MSRGERGGKLGTMRFLMPSLLLVATGACGGRAFGPPMPTALAPVDPAMVAGWVGGTQAGEPTMLRFRWTFQDEKGAAKGRGSAIILPPDSLRFDFRGPLGSGSGAAAVVGDLALWAEPEEEVDKLVPNYPLLWAMLGKARAPTAGDALRGYRDEHLTAWRYSAGADTVDYILVHGSPRQLIVDVRQGGSRIGRVATTLDAVGHPVRARMEIPRQPARLDLSFYVAGPLDDRPADLWTRPDDAP